MFSAVSSARTEKLLLERGICQQSKACIAAIHLVQVLTVSVNGAAVCTL